MFITSSLPATSRSRRKERKVLVVRVRRGRRTGRGPARRRASARSRRPRSWADAPRRSALRSPRARRGCRHARKRTERLHSPPHGPSPDASSTPTSTTPTAGASRSPRCPSCCCRASTTAAAESVAEVGAFAGDLTRVLVGLGRRRRRARAGDRPGAAARARRLAENRPALELIRETSLEALGRIPLPDVVDHRRRPQLLHGQRGAAADRRSAPRRRAAAAAVSRRVLAARPPRRLLRPQRRSRRTRASRRRATPAALVPGRAGARARRASVSALGRARGRPDRNGVLTAIEDFVAVREDLRLVVVPAFFGFGAAVAPRRRPGPTELGRLLDPFDRNPILERLEANRVAAPRPPAQRAGGAVA